MRAPTSSQRFRSLRARLVFLPLAQRLLALLQFVEQHRRGDGAARRGSPPGSAAPVSRCCMLCCTLSMARARRGVSTVRPCPVLANPGKCLPTSRFSRPSTASAWSLPPRAKGDARVIRRVSSPHCRGRPVAAPRPRRQTSAPRRARPAGRIKAGRAGVTAPCWPPAGCGSLAPAPRPARDGANASELVRRWSTAGQPQRRLPQGWIPRRREMRGPIRGRSAASPEALSWSRLWSTVRRMKAANPLPATPLLISQRLVSW